DERLARLPKWAPGRIDLLERNLEHARRELQQVSAERPDIRWGGISDDFQGAIPEGEPIRFGYANPDSPLPLLQIGWEGETMTLLATEGSIVVMPECSNVVKV
ncbi:unnamed protein product, partial [Scytosiphon promiscuus]